MYPHTLHVDLSCSHCISVAIHTVLSDLYQEKLVTEDEVKRIAGELLLFRLVHVQCTKPPEDASRTADVFDKYGHNEEARRLRG